MNKVILSGRLAKDPEVMQEGSSDKTAVTKYILAVPKKIVPDVGPKVDYVTLTAFGQDAVFAAKWLEKGTKVFVLGKIRSGSYVNKDNQTVYTTDIVVVEQEFGENKAGMPEGFKAPAFTDDLKEERPVEPPEPVRRGRR